jgi:hypothetical protein
VAAWLRIAAFAALGAILFGGLPHLVYPLQSAATIAFAADPPPGLLSGFYPVEHTREGFTFAWTRSSFGLNLPGLDRARPWTVTMRLAAARPDGTSPQLAAMIDGRVQPTVTLPPSGFVERSFTLDARPGGLRGASLAFAVVPTFVPGPADRRELGVQVDWIRLDTPARWPRLPGGAPPLAAGLVAGALVGVLATPAAGAVMLVLLAAGAASVATLGLAPFTSLPWLPIVSAAFAAAAAAWLASPRRSSGSGLVAAVTFAAVELQLLVLFHPAMPVGDALFHTHRFMEVLAGHYIFTSIAPGNYQFPYPVGLYVAAAPFARWAASVADKMALLRLVVVAVDGVASGLLYRLVVRWRGDVLAGVAAVVVYHLLPLGFSTIATGNLTNVFAQSIAMVTLVAACDVASALGSDRSRPGWRARWSAGGLVGIAACAAFLSHTSTFAVLGGQLVLAGLALGVSRAPARRRAGGVLLAAAMAAVAVAIVVYYAHFLDVYRAAFTRAAAETGHATAAAGGRTPWARLADVPRLVHIWYGIPGALLAVAGGVGVARDRPGSPTRTILAMWLLACLFFLIVGIVTPIDLRHYLAALPVVAVLAGVAVAEGWRAGGPARWAVSLLALWAAWVGAVSWFSVL